MVCLHFELEDPRGDDEGAVADVVAVESKLSAEHGTQLNALDRWCMMGGCATVTRCCRSSASAQRLFAPKLSTFALVLHTNAI